jgi:uncharacterized protein YjbJ (UPF0337 family)
MAEGKFDEAKGRAKEAVGDLKGDRDLEREGKADRAAGDFKGKVANIVDKVRNAVSGRR